MTWVDGKEHDDILAYAESVLGKGCVMEYECYDWNGRAQGKACLRVEDWSDAGRGFLVGDHLIASDGCYEWYGQQYLKDGKGLYHLCSGDRTKCKAKLPRGDGTELVHISRWRLANILMMHDMEYARKKAMDGIISFVDGWTPRVPEPAGAPPPKEKPEALADQGTKKDRPEAACDPTALGQDLEKAKQAAKEREPQEIVAGDGKKVFPNEPRGSVGTLLEKKAAERREELRQKEKERRKKSRGRSRSRKIRKGNKRKGESSSERRHIREPGGVRSAPSLGVGERSHQELIPPQTARLSAKKEAASLGWKELMSKSRASRQETGRGKS